MESDDGSIFRYSPHENSTLAAIHRQLEVDLNPPTDAQSLKLFIRSITTSPKDSTDSWTGSRSMIDLWEMVKRYYYAPDTKGSNSIKDVLPAILAHSKFIQETKPDKSQGEFAKLLTAACVRRGFLEKLHAGKTPVTKTGDYSDVKVIDAEGREIPWNEVSRIDQAEMKMLITGVVDRVYTFLSRTIFSPTQDPEFEKAVDRTAAPWTKAWDEPKFLPGFLIPVNLEKRNRLDFVWIRRDANVQKINGKVQCVVGLWVLDYA